MFKSRLQDRLFFVLLRVKGVEFETVGYEYRGNVGNLLEKYWSLDSFGADLRGRKWDEKNAAIAKINEMGIVVTSTVRNACMTPHK